MKVREQFLAGKTLHLLHQNSFSEPQQPKIAAYRGVPQNSWFILWLFYPPALCNPQFKIFFFPNQCHSLPFQSCCNPVLQTQMTVMEHRLQLFVKFKKKKKNLNINYVQWCSYFKTHAVGRWNTCLVGFPPGCSAWELNAGENPKVCVCSSPTCHAWKLFLLERVIYIRSSHHSSPPIVPYIYAKPHWWGVWDCISVNYNVLPDPLASQRRFGEG